MSREDVVSLRQYVEALFKAQERRLDDFGAELKAFVVRYEERHENLLTAIREAEASRRTTGQIVSVVLGGIAAMGASIAAVFYILHA